MQDSSIYKKSSYVAVTLFWLLTMGILIQRHYNIFKFSAPVRHRAVLPPGSLDEQWMGVYLKGVKIGYCSRKMSSSGKGYKMDEAFRIKIMVMGTEKDVETLLDADLDEDLKLLSFNTSMKGDLEMQISGILQGKDMSLTINSGGVKTTKTIHLSKAPSLESSAITEVLRRRKPGDRISVPIFDPTLMGVEDLELSIAGKEEIMSLGKLEEAYKVNATMKGIEINAWVTEKGEVLREESPMGFLLVRETKEAALKIDKPSLDLISEVAVPFGMKLPSNCSYLKVRITGINFRGLELDGGRQSLKGDVLEINREEISGTKSLGTDTGDKDLEENLSGTIFIQSKDTRIMALAKAIVRDEKNSLASARLVYEWVYRNIEKVPTITIPMATDVLRTRKGDCNEHTTLFTALARAAGIPSRIAVGLVYKDGSFYYHAWPEFYAGKWIAADPTLGQFPADAAHIRLITGDLDKQIQILPVINRIRLDGLAYR